jgi:hypothetical protein
MRRATNILLAIAAAISLVLLFWPFAEWNGVMSVALRVIAAVAAQALFCRVRGLRRVKAAPALLTGALAAWGVYLYLTSPHWIGVTVGDLIADYVAPLIGCMAVLLVHLLLKKNKNIARRNLK